MAVKDRKCRSLGSLESPTDGGARVLTAAQKAVISDLVMLPELSILFVKADGKEPGPHVAGAVERTGAVSCKCILLDFLAGAPCSDEKFVRLRVSHRAGLPNKAMMFFRTQLSTGAEEGPRNAGPCSATTCSQLG